MKRLVILGLGVMVCIVVLTGCSEESAPLSVSQGDSQPTIESLTVFPEAISLGLSSTVTASVKESGVPYECFWSADHGSFAGQLNGTEITWIAPAEAVEATITLTIRTAHDEISSSAIARVVSYQVPTIVDERVLFYGQNLIVHQIKPTPDGGFIAAGENWFEHSWRGRRWVAKLTSTYLIEWEWTSDSDDRGAYYGIDVTPDGEYIAAGGEHSVQFLGISSRITKFSASGEIVWNKTRWGDWDLEYWKCVKATSDGGCIAVKGGDEPQMVRLSPEGRRVWRQPLETDRPWRISEVEGGWIVLARYRQTDDESDISEFSEIHMVSEAGYTSWIRRYGNETLSDAGRQYTDIENVVETNSGDILAVGTKWGPVDDESCAYFRFMTMLNHNGETVWERVVGLGQGISEGILETHTGQFVTSSLLDRELRLSGFDSYGHQLWSTRVRDGISMNVHGIHRSTSGNILVLGDKNFSGPNQIPAYMLKITVP